MKRLMPGAVLLTLLLACGESTTDPGNGGGGGGGGPVPVPGVLLKEIVIPSLPNPYYHFDYDSTGRLSAASFASGLTMYQVLYQGDRISQLRNNTLANQDRLEYVYDGGRVTRINYTRSTGQVFTRVTLSYEGEQLTGLVRQRLLSGSFVVDKVMTFSYHPDGNLAELTIHRPAIAGSQPETTTLDRFDQYDDKINVDGFGLLHDEFFDHLVLLPGVQLQKGNPARVTRTGDGINFQQDNSYDYDELGRPRSTTGDLVLLNGPDVGRHFQTGSSFTYY